MSPRRPSPPHPQAHLPALDGDDALLIVNILQRITDAIWRAHGPAMHASLEETCRNVPATTSAVSSPSRHCATLSQGRDGLPF